MIFSQMKKTANRSGASDVVYYSRTSQLLVLILLWCCAGPLRAEGRISSTSVPEPVSLDTLAKVALSLADKPYEEDADTLPESLTSLTYDQYRAIRFDPGKALWREQSPFEIQFFHPGFIFRNRVKINTLTPEGSVQPFPYSRSNFTLGKPVADLKIEKSEAPGYAGFRVHYPLNSKNYKDEVAVFQGASYFRLVGPGQVYGLSARGVAVDTAESSGEEFPRFVEFWLQPPQNETNTLVMYALLDSASLTGAYRFELTPGVNTEMLVEARLFARNDINKLGLAPLTSMFFYGENSVVGEDDYRPEVHDSDGLLLATADGEWIWRPLNNPSTLSVVSFQGKTPKGFGLLQRDRRFERYLDAEAHYHDRPGVWIQPLGDWGSGRVELVEIPTDSETNDNIVAYWVADKKIRKGDAVQIRYRMSTVNQGPGHAELAKVVRTRNGWGYIPGQERPPQTHRQFIVEFQGDALSRLGDEQEVEADLSVNAGKVSDLVVTKLAATGAWRASFKVQTEEDKPADMRLFLKLRNQRLSEVWSYVWNAGDIPE